MIAAFVFAISALGAARPGAEHIHFGVAPGTKLLKVVKTSHELQLDSISSSTDDMPAIVDPVGGWVSSNQRFDFLDQYVACDDARPTRLQRGFIAASSDGRLDATLSGAKQLADKSHSQSPLIGQSVSFTWIADEHDWSRCYDRVDAEEQWLAPLRGEFDLLALLPPSDVEPGAQWDIDLARLREVFAPGGDLSMLPSGGSRFGRSMELGIGGDFADFLSEHPQGRAHATFGGARDIELDDGSQTEPAAPPRKLRVAVIALEFDLTSRRDRTDLYRIAMPADERAEAARLDSVPLEYTLRATGELVWDLAAGHFHSLSIRGRESYFTQVQKTQFTGAETHQYAQQSRFSGALSIDVQCSDGAHVAPPIARDDPASARRR
jgi:hypothetical protein